MPQPYVGEIRMFGGNYAPRGWADCDGQLLAVSQFDALFSLFGTMYGGDGRTTFGLPDLRGRVPEHYGPGPGLNPVVLGHKGGAEQVTLNGNQLAGHTHHWGVTTTAGTEQAAVGAVLGQSTAPVLRANPPAPSLVNLADDAINKLGGGQSHNNLMPYQVVRYIVAVYGIYPTKS